MHTFNADITLKLLEDHLWYGQAEAHPAAINILGLRYLAEKSKKPMQVVFSNSNPSVLNLGYQLAIMKFYADSNRAMKRKLHSVTNQIE